MSLLPRTKGAACLQQQLKIAKITMAEAMIPTEPLVEGGPQCCLNFTAYGGIIKMFNQANATGQGQFLAHHDTMPPMWRFSKPKNLWFGDQIESIPDLIQRVVIGKKFEVNSQGGKRFLLRLRVRFQGIKTFYELALERMRRTSPYLVHFVSGERDCGLFINWLYFCQQSSSEVSEFEV